MTDNNKRIGFVKFHNWQKNFGFITMKDEAGDAVDVFFASRDMEEPFKRLMPDDRVRFQLTQGSRGPKALNVEKLAE